MIRSRTFLACFVTAFFLTSAGTAAAYHTRFVKWDAQVKKRQKLSIN